MKKIILLILCSAFLFACSSGGGSGGDTPRAIPMDGTYEATSVKGYDIATGAEVDVYDVWTYRYQMMYNPRIFKVCIKIQYYDGEKYFNNICETGNSPLTDGDGITFSGNAESLTVTVTDLEEGVKIVIGAVRTSTSTTTLDNSLIYEWDTIGVTYMPKMIDDKYQGVLHQLFKQ